MSRWSKRNQKLPCNILGDPFSSPVIELIIRAKPYLIRSSKFNTSKNVTRPIMMKSYQSNLHFSANEFLFIKLSVNFNATSTSDHYLNRDTAVSLLSHSTLCNQQWHAKKKKKKGNRVVSLKPNCQIRALWFSC